MRSFSFSVLLLIGLTGPFTGVAAETVTPTQCGPGDSGAPCGGDGPASQGNSSATNQGVGNPINVITGNKYQQETDLPALPGVLGLEIVRHYNSAQSDPRTPPGILGRGWRLSYETDLYAIGNTLQIIQADGTRIIFIRNPNNPSLCATNNPGHGQVTIHKTPRGEEYRWTWTNGRTLSFNTQGRLTEIRAPSGEFVSLTRDLAGALVKVTDPQGRSLIFGYPQRKHPDRFNGVTHIQSPIGRFVYSYGSVPSGTAANGAPINPRDLLANLVRVDLPGAIQRHYHFEDPAHPTLLTGISIAGQGSTPQRLATWAYDAQGRGILSVKGTPKRIGKDGKPVPGTGIEQVSLSYAPGKTTLTNSLDQTTTYIHAIVGNEHRLLEVKGAGCASCGETNVRYGYDKLGRLIQTTKLRPTGQPLATTQTQRDTLGRPIRIDRIAYDNGQAQPAKLQVRYEYAGQGTQPTLIARPSVIPGKEAITRITYNPAGQPIQITKSGFSPLDDKAQRTATPIQRTTTYSYSTINGRSLLTQIDGPLANGQSNSPVDSDIYLVKYDRRGTPLSVVSPGAFNSAVQYDAAGRIAAVGQAVASPVPQKALMVTATPEAKSLAAVEVIRDAYARPVAWNTSGQTLLAASWGEAGTIGESSMLTLSSVSAAALRLIDDFGRVVGIRNPGMGWQTARYDAGNRMVQIIDPRGARQTAQYDVAGRLLRLQRHSPASRSPEETIVLRWQGNQQIEASVQDAAGVRRTLWQRDAQGRVVEETQEIALARRKPVRFVLRRNRDKTNERTTLGDASGTHSTLIKEADDKGRVQRLRIAGALPEWLGGGSSLVEQISWTSVAGTQFAERIVYADGRTDQWPTVGNKPSAPQAVALVKSAPGHTGLFRPGGRHDSAGLPGIIETAAGRLVLNWDAAGRLAKIGQGDTSERFIYDAQGRRVAKIIGSRIRYFAYDGIQLAGEADASGGLLTRYAYLGYRPIAQIIGPQGLWQRVTAWLFGPKVNTYSTSKAGRALALYDMSGRVVWKDAEAAGIRRVSLMKALHQPLRDVGQYADDESGLVYHMARFLDPESGRFLSPDPKGIADAVEHTRPDLILNPYAYVGGYAEEFFDPDGAAKIRYYAITTGDRERNKGYGTLGMDQGFTKARWAFVIYDIQGGGDSNTDLGQLRNQYANTNTGLLFDGKGNFIGSANDPLTGITNPTNTAIKQEGGISPLSQAFVNHYAGNIIGIPQFDIKFDDDNATKLIWYLMGKDEERMKCKNTAPGWLPEIKFAPGEDNIKVTQNRGVDANTPATSQRILNCNINQTSTLPVQYANGEERQRVEKIEAAAEGNETSALNRDCSADGCPGIGIAGQNGRTYHASYGRSQFVGETFIRTLNSLSPAEKGAIGITPALQIRLNNAVTRSNRVGRAPNQNTNDPGGWFYKSRHQTTCAGAAAYWDNAGQPSAMSVANRNAFIQDTQLDRQAYIDMVCFVPQGNARPIGEGRNAFMTEAIFADTTLETWLMDLYKSVDRFNFVSRTFIRDNLRKVLLRPELSTQFQNNETPGSAAYAARQREIERNIAMRVARLHNGGGRPYDVNLNALLTNDPGAYVRDFLGARGNWPSLRCGEGQGANATWRGLLLTPLILN